MVGDSRILEVLDSIGSRSPTPGGGSVSALAAALSGALVSMVGNLSLGKGEGEPEMREVVESAATLRQRALELYEEDISAFNEVMRALRLPRETQADKDLRRKALEEALEGAMAVPMDLARLALRLMGLAATVAGKGNVNAASDAGVALLMASSALEGAAMNVRINAASLKGEARERKGPLLGELEELEREGLRLKDTGLKSVARNLR